MDVAPNGDVFAAIRTTRVDGRPVPGGVVVLRDTDNDGRADRRAKFGEFSASQVVLQGNQLWTETGSAILRYSWNPGQMTLTGPDTIVSGLPGDRSHTAKTFVIHRGQLYVNHGSATNACQEQDRVPGSKGIDPCPELATRAGIFRFDMNRRGQTMADAQRFATGIRNAVAMDVGPSGALYVVQHGRDMLSNNWPAMFSDAKSAETPAEEFFRVSEGDDFGWPYCYFDPDLKKKVLAPEYGGDGTTVGRCEDKKGNIGYFPGHWAPNGLLFYTGNALPERYRNGAFIVFHGSWNRAPLPQQGFKVVFQPMRDGRASGDFEVIVDGFMSNGQPTSLGGRPMSLAQGPRGELYLSDDSRGRIWKITYQGSR
jgi:glucose/arabinose dehydrogenase